MKVTIESMEGSEVEAVAEDVDGLEVAVHVCAYVEQEQAGFNPCRATSYQIMEEYLPRAITIERVRVLVGMVGGVEKFLDVNIDYSQKEQIIDGISNEIDRANVEY